MNSNNGLCKARRSFADFNSHTSENADVARRLVEQGIKVLPLAVNKRPLAPRGFHDAACDASPWRIDRHALVGLPTSFFWVLDLDPPLECSVQALCSMLRCDWRDLTAKCGCIVRTPRGGYHLSWLHTPGVAIRTAAGDIGAGIDTRGHDLAGNPTGYVVAPGCFLPDGRKYEFEKGELRKLREAPSRLLWLAVFSRWERGRIATDAVLTAAIRSAQPSAWRPIFTANRAGQERSIRPEHELAEPMRRQALHDLASECKRIASLTDGRRQAIFAAAARLARYVAHGILSPAEIEASFLDAWHASGGAQRHGLRYASGAIGRALEKGSHDPLPPLMNQFRDTTVGQPQ